MSIFNFPPDNNCARDKFSYNSNFKYNCGLKLSIINGICALSDNGLYLIILHNKVMKSNLYPLKLQNSDGHSGAFSWSSSFGSATRASAFCSQMALHFYFILFYLFALLFLISSFFTLVYSILNLFTKQKKDNFPIVHLKELALSFPKWLFIFC